MDCPRCGVPVKDGAQFCEYCGKDLRGYNRPVQQGNMQQQENRQTYYQPPQNQQYNGGGYNNDKKSIGLNIISWFFPIVGIILYFACKKEKPIRSKSNLKVAVISIVVNTVLGLILSVALAGLMVKTAISTPGARITINGEEYIIDENGETVPAYEYAGSDREDEYRWSDDEGSKNVSSTTEEANSEYSFSDDDDSFFDDVGFFIVNGEVIYAGEKIDLPISCKEFMSIVQKEQYGEDLLQSTVIYPGQEKAITLYRACSDSDDTGLKLTLKNSSEHDQIAFDCDVIDVGFEFNFD